MIVPSLYLEAGLFGWSFKNKLNQIISYLADKNISYTNYNIRTSYSSTEGVFHEVTGLTTTITPRKASNKIEVSLNVNISSSFTSIEPAIKIKRDGVIVGTGVSEGSRPQLTAYGVPTNGTNRAQTISFSFIDEPESTEELEYTVEVGQIMTGSATTLAVNGTAANTDNVYNARYMSSLKLKEL